MSLEQDMQEQDNHFEDYKKNLDNKIEVNKKQIKFLSIACILLFVCCFFSRVEICVFVFFSQQVNMSVCLCVCITFLPE